MAMAGRSTTAGGPCIVLNVAEKPSVARALAQVFSQMPGSQNRPNVRNPAAQIFCHDNVQFPKITTQGSGQMQQGNIQSHNMITTAVRGHLASQDFPSNYGWSQCPPTSLFQAPIETSYREDMKALERMLQTQARSAHALILWLDCDREGEAICDEVREVCLRGNPRLRNYVYRAKFSTVLPQEIQRALKSLGRVNECFVQAVQARSEHDLRVGAAFTRFQTLLLQKNFDEFADGSQGVVSYGPCQFPTLGFVVERWARIETFVPEDFWSLDMSVRVDANGAIEGAAIDTDIRLPGQEERQPQHVRGRPQGRAIHFKWKRERLYDRLITLSLYESCLNAEEATVTSLTGRPKNKWRPVPLATVELQKRASRYLRIGSETLMSAAEELYNQGYISYPRTETEKFRPEFEHRPLIQSFQGITGELGEYATKLLSNNNFQNPRAGRNDDNAHPPITPCKAVDPSSIPDHNKRQIYILVVKHYLACCSRDAMGKETVLTVKMASEEFKATGLMILERNWLEIYSPWERWSTGQGELPQVQIGSRIRPSSFLMKDGRTAAPNPISEVELISLMDRNGIGTDATIATHITTIQERSYATKDGQKFLPTKLGIALIEGYNSMGFKLNRPDLRREMEAECNDVANGRKRKEEIMEPILAKMLECFTRVNDESHKLHTAVARHFTKIGCNEANTTLIRGNFSVCGQCSGMTTLKELKGNNNNQQRRNRQDNNVTRTKIVHCSTCSHALRLPKGNPSPMTKPSGEEPLSCPICNFQVIKIGQGQGYTGNGYHVCPNCFSNAPSEHGGSSTSGDFRCFNCTHPTCTLASATKGGDVQILACPFCESSGTSGKITLRKNSRSYVLSCSNYITNGSRERCQYTIWLPKEASKISVPDDESGGGGGNENDNQNVAPRHICNRCSTPTKVVRKLHFQWKPGSVPPDFDREHIACVLCDPLLKNELNVSIPSLNQVQIRGGGRRRPDQGRGSSTNRNANNGGRSRNFNRSW